MTDRERRPGVEVDLLVGAVDDAATAPAAAGGAVAARRPVTRRTAGSP